MKKKLLTIILSAFMMLISMPVNADSSFTTSGQILATVSNVEDWISERYYLFSEVRGCITGNETVTNVGDNTYEFTVGDVTIDLITDGTLLTSINVSGFKPNEYNGKYVQKTIWHVMPNDLYRSGIAYINENCESIYLFFDDALYFSLLQESVEDFESRKVIKSGNDYVCNLTTVESSLNFTIKFIMDEDNCKSIEISGFTGDNAIANGTYKCGIDLFDIITNDLPLQSQTHWVGSNGGELYIDKSDIIYFANDVACLRADSYTLALLKDPNDNSKYYTKDIAYDMNCNPPLDIGRMSLTFNFDGTVLKNIEATFDNNDYSSLSGVYTPVTNTVSDVISFGNVKPSTVWVNDRGAKILVNGSNLMAAEEIIPFITTMSMQNDGNYKLAASQEYLFVINDEAVRKIIVTGSSDDKNDGEYLLYGYTNDPISKPVGYTGNIEFVTNGSYTNDDEVTVKVDNDTLTLNEHYTLAHGSTHVLLLGDYVKTLAKGTHTITISVIGYGDIAQDFTITEANKKTDSKPMFIVPKTGVN